MADRWEKFTEPKEPKLPKAPEAKIITEKVVTKMEKADKIQKLKDSQKMPDYNKVINQRIEEIKAKNMPKQEPTLEQKISDKKKEYSNYLQKSMPTGIGVLLKKCIDGVRSGKLIKAKVLKPDFSDQKNDIDLHFKPLSSDIDFHFRPLSDEFLNSRHPLTVGELNTIDSHLDWSVRMIDKAHPDHDADVIDWHNNYLDKLANRIENSMASLNAPKAKKQERSLKLVKALNKAKNHLKKNAPPPPPMPPPPPAPPPPSGPALNSGAVSAFQRGFLGG